MISFIRYSKQSYWPESYKPDRDDILVADYDDEGGCTWEAAVRQHVFFNGDAVLRVEIYGGSLIALDEPLVVKALRSLKGCRTLDEAELRLVAAGIPTMEPRKEKSK